MARQGTASYNELLTVFAGELVLHMGFEEAQDLPAELCFLALQLREALGDVTLTHACIRSTELDMAGRLLAICVVCRQIGCNVTNAQEADAALRSAAASLDLGEKQSNYAKQVALPMSWWPLTKQRNSRSGRRSYCFLSTRTCCTGSAGRAGQASKAWQMSSATRSELLSSSTTSSALVQQVLLVAVTQVASCNMQGARTVKRLHLVASCSAYAQDRGCHPGHYRLLSIC